MLYVIIYEKKNHYLCLLLIFIGATVRNVNFVGKFLLLGIIFVALLGIRDICSHSYEDK